MSNVITFPVGVSVRLNLTVGLAPGFGRFATAFGSLHIPHADTLTGSVSFVRSGWLCPKVFYSKAYKNIQLTFRKLP